MNENSGEVHSQTIPAGWYPDGSGGQRWWDGQQWTEHHQAGEQPASEIQVDPNRVPRRKLSTAARNAMIAAIAVIVLGGASALTFTLVSGAQGDTERAASTPTTTSEPQATPDSSSRDAESDSSGGFADMFEERDEFMKAQQQPVGDEVLTAVTPEQKELVAEARAHVEQKGEIWDEEQESLVLVLALNACETSILNGHDINESTVQMHVATSPVLTALLQGATEEQRVSAVTGLMNLTVTGTTYLCPADSEQWSSAVQTIGSDW